VKEFVSETIHRSMMSWKDDKWHVAHSLHGEATAARKESGGVMPPAGRKAYETENVINPRCFPTFYILQVSQDTKDGLRSACSP
jgi:hypothetical protein